MPWIIGIDEAGYGPNLGPFVMTAVACRVSQASARPDLWEVFHDVARRHCDPDDHRFVVADSKLVYAPGCGLGCLEKTVMAALPVCGPSTLADLVDLVSSDCHQGLRREVWYDGTTPVPLAGGELHRGPIRAAIVCPAAFNAQLDRWGTKGAVLASSLVQLLRTLPCDGEPTTVFIDKHGGRNSYSALLQPAFDDGLVMARIEGSQRSTYEVLDGTRPVEITFEPRADANHFCVALASMVSKYIRELLMLEFNRFWQAKIPGLKQTAGYPLDAKRFWADIRGTVAKLGLEEDSLWRRK